MEKLTRDTFMTYLRNATYGKTPTYYSNKTSAESSAYFWSIQNFTNSLAENTWPLMKRRSNADLKRTRREP